MAEIFDLKLKDDFDILIQDGDFVIGESTRQHQQCILIAEPGNYLQTPTIGAGVYSHINNDEAKEIIKKEIQKSFEADGMTISKLEMKASGEIDVIATY